MLIDEYVFGSVYLMGKKSFIIILVLSVVITIGVPLISFSLGQYKLAKGLPLEYVEFSFLGGSTNYSTFLIDIIFWFVIIWVVWKLLTKFLKR